MTTHNTSDSKHEALEPFTDAELDAVEEWATWKARIERHNRQRLASAIAAATTSPETPESDASWEATLQEYRERINAMESDPVVATADNEGEGYCWVCRSTHVLTANNCRAMDGIA